MDLADNRYAGALQGVEDLPELLERGGVELKLNPAPAGTLEVNGSVSSLIRASHRDAEKPYVEAIGGLVSKPLKHVAIERHYAVVVDLDFQRIHDG